MENKERVSRKRKVDEPKVRNKHPRLITKRYGKNTRPFLLFTTSKFALEPDPYGSRHHSTPLDKIKEKAADKALFTISNLADKPTYLFMARVLIEGPLLVIEVGAMHSKDDKSIRKAYRNMIDLLGY